MGKLDQLAIGDVAPVVYDVVRVANPGAGTDPIIAVPGNAVWEVLALTGILTTSVAVANRRPSLIVDDQTTTVFQIPTGVVSAASLATRYSFVSGYDFEAGAAGVAVADPMPGSVVIPGGWRLRVVTTAIDAADQWSSVTVWVRRIDLGVSALALARKAVEDEYDEPTAFM